MHSYMPVVALAIFVATLLAILTRPRGLGEGVAALMTSARNLPYVHAATIFGTSLHLLVDAGVSNAQLQKDLQQDVAVSEIEPSLEDVFVRLTETRGKEVEAARAGAAS